MGHLPLLYPYKHFFQFCIRTSKIIIFLVLVLALLLLFFVVVIVVAITFTDNFKSRF